MIASEQRDEENRATGRDAASSDGRTIRSAQELLDAGIELIGIQFFELCAKVDEDSESTELPESIEPTFSLRLRHEGNEFGIRLASRVYVGLGEVTVDVSANYATPEPVTMDEAVRLEFANRVGIMALIPYLRQAVADLTQRVFGQPILVPITRAGDLEFTPDSQLDE
ncbi:hypothetical protein [Microbacterium lacticum]